MSWNFRNIDLIISVYFVIEVILRIIALTPKGNRFRYIIILIGCLYFSVFFSKKSWHNIVDFVVVILSFAATIAAFVVISSIKREEKEEVDGHLCERKAESVTGKGLSLLVIIRGIRIFRFVRLLRLYFEHRWGNWWQWHVCNDPMIRRLVKGVRQLISENKRRFQVDGYDLDLTYILDNVIAMSFPSKGTKAMYR